MVTIMLTPELEEALTNKAQQQGTTPELLALESLREQFLPVTLLTQPTEEGTMADFLAEFIGSINSSEVIPGGAHLSEDTGRKFTELLLKKRQEGRL